MPKSNQKPKRALASVLEESTTPPDGLETTQTIARVIKAEGNNLYSVVLPSEYSLPDSTTTSDPTSKQKDSSTSDQSHLVELLPALRSTVFLRRNGYVLVDTNRELLGGRENKIVGIVVGVVLSGKIEKEWRVKPYWPSEFTKTRKGWDGESSDGDENVGPQMPDVDDE